MEGREREEVKEEGREELRNRVRKGVQITTSLQRCHTFRRQLSFFMDGKGRSGEPDQGGRYQKGRGPEFRASNKK